ncbi:uncharacterized protein [Ptychodera flava]|uniref:uncharacterized protein n=1 Tax=Ptychodera flava TaxID=63121 RepID=UPI003969F45D
MAETMESDVVYWNNQPIVIDIVDPIRKQILSTDGEIIQSSDIRSLQVEVADPEKRVQRRKRKPVSQPSVAREDVRHSGFLYDHMSARIRNNLPLEAVISENGVVIQCGKVYSALGVRFLCESIITNGTDPICRGYIIYNSTVCKESTISIPASRVIIPDTNVAVHSLAAVAAEVKRRAAILVMDALQKEDDNTYSSYVRRHHLAVQIRSEARACMKSKSMKKTVNLGLCYPTTDLPALHLAAPNYANVLDYVSNSIHRLDQLLCRGWDVYPLEHFFYYIIKLKIVKTSANMISLQLRSAICRQPFSDNYRNTVMCDLSRELTTQEAE